ncbi:homocysteine-responsive endoplasmic reticulum-resident ubiquitin-like domain member 2 protein [Hylaeus volcanicus]|uniref:homocysteine-responsive endoplasmic reticulum-resident ubiquitin-like domain member 2 protein n=1 Tax=Hylaeus volcanicus TaxID=313075 RepID=UPI0023B7A871|nr:homocysteine-responsive endoplasmic reticulum-resident ubiquitin-like domain member 2 protein [Hylaeus volcanicus]
MEEAAVKLIIKAPNQQIKDQVVECDIGWTIGRLKEYLSEVYPSKPERASQKLIYSGQLLNDSTCLKDVLRQYDGQEDRAYTVHLVCASQKTTTNRMTSEQDSEHTDHQRVTLAQIRLIIGNDAQNQGQDINNAVIQQSPTQLYSTQQYFDPRNSQQIAWMQQAYTHYFTQYMQLMAAQGIQVRTSIPYVQQMNINTNDSVQNLHMNTTNNNNNNNNVGDEQQQPAAQDADINGGNNGAAEDGAFDRDWLDFFYMLSRIIVLFSIVYFYSSPLRFLIVIFLGFVMYLYQIGFFRGHPIPLFDNDRVDRVDNNNQAWQNEAVGPQPMQQQQNGQLPAVQAEARTNANEEHEEERPGALAFTWTFFSTFFASLIPDQPNVI